jgi:hypothetical protein
MAPSEGLGSGGDGVPAPAERALSFISKSLTEVQKSTGMDMKLIQSRVESALRDKSKSLDRNWKESSLANFPAKAKLDVRNVSVEDFDLLKSLKPKLDSSWSDMSMQGRKSELRSRVREEPRERGDEAGAREARCGESAGNQEED